MSAARTSALLGAAQLYYKLTAFVTFAVAARCLGAAELGDFFTAMAFAGVLVALVGLGMPPLVMRRVALEPASASAEMSEVLGLRLATLPLFASAIALAGVAMQAAHWPLWAAAGVIVAGEDAYVSAGAVFLGLSRANVNVAIGTAVQTAYALGAVAVLWTTGSLEGFVAVQVARVAALLLAAWMVSHRLLGAVRPRLSRRVLRGVVPFALTAGLRGLAEQGDSVLVGTLLAPAVMAHYQFALRTISAGTFVPYVVAAAMLPEVSAGGPGATRLIRRAVAMLTGVALLLAVPMWLAPDSVATMLFGEVGASVAPYLTAFAWLAPLWFAQIFLTSMLQALGSEKAAMANVAAGVLVGLALALPATVHYGAFGAIAARIVAAALQVCLAVYLLARMHERPSGELAAIPLMPS